MVMLPKLSLKIQRRLFDATIDMVNLYKL